MSGAPIWPALSRPALPANSNAYRPGILVARSLFYFLAAFNQIQPWYGRVVVIVDVVVVVVDVIVVAAAAAASASPRSVLPLCPAAPSVCPAAIFFLERFLNVTGDPISVLNHEIDMEIPANCAALCASTGGCGGQFGTANLNTYQCVRVCVYE